MINTNNQDIWIETGYEVFALKGQIGLKVEPLAQKVGKSKSSFYHHFADLELFIGLLLEHHIKQSYLIADKERNARNIDPELIIILVIHRIDLLFNRQLRINKNIPLFEETLCKSNKIIGDAFKTAWSKDLNSALSQKQIEGVFTLAIENFYLQINPDNLNYNWLSAYFNDLKRLTSQFI
jgi:AcrR family transcriptional regulator